MTRNEGAAKLHPFGWAILEREEVNMTSDWIDYIFVNFRRDGRFSVKAYKRCESFRDRGPNRIWLRLDSVVGVKGVPALLEAIRKVSSDLWLTLDDEEVLSGLEKMSPVVAAEARRLMDA